MADRQFLVARLVAETQRRTAPPALARMPDTRSDGRRPRLGLSHPRIDGNYRSTISKAEEAPKGRISGPSVGEGEGESSNKTSCK